MAAWAPPTRSITTSTDAPPRARHQVCAAINGVVGSLCHHVGGLHRRADRNDRRATAFCELHCSDSDSPRGPCYEHSLRRDAGSVQHVLCGRIGARYGCEFFIAAVAANGVRLSGGGDRELCEPAVTFAAEGPALERPIADRRPQHVPYEDSLADATARNSSAHVDDTAADVRALDARELKGGTRPRGVHVVDAVEARCATFTGLGGDRLRIPSDPRVHVRIVDTGCGNLNENLTPSRARNLHVRSGASRSSPPCPVSRTAAIVSSAARSSSSTRGRRRRVPLLCHASGRANNGRLLDPSGAHPHPGRQPAPFDALRRRNRYQSSVRVVAALERSRNSIREAASVRSPTPVDDDLDQSVIEPGLDLVTPGSLRQRDRPPERAVEPFPHVERSARRSPVPKSPLRVPETVNTPVGEPQVDVLRIHAGQLDPDHQLVTLDEDVGRRHPGAGVRALTVLERVLAAVRTDLAYRDRAR